MNSPRNPERKDIEPRWEDWAKSIRKWREDKPVPEPPKVAKPNAVRCSNCDGTGVLEKGRNRYGAPKCLSCDGTGEVEAKSPSALAEMPGEFFKESHIFNVNGFCTKCGWEKGFLEREGKVKCANENAVAKVSKIADIPASPTYAPMKRKLSRSQKRKASIRTCNSPDAWALGGKCHCRNCNNDLAKWQSSGIEVNPTLIAFLGFGLLLLLPTMCSNPNKAPDYLGSAEEKMDKNLPLNSQETRAVNDSIGYKSDEETTKEIEKKHGE